MKKNKNRMNTIQLGYRRLQVSVIRISIVFFLTAMLLARPLVLAPFLWLFHAVDSLDVSQTWSNRNAQVLTKIFKNVYVAERPFIWNNIDVGGRSVIIKSSQSDDLMVHSPIECTDSLQKELEKIGKVKWVVSPNYEHLKYAHQWSEKFPDASMCACPGLPARLPDIPWKYEFGAEKQATTAILPTEDFEYLHFDCELNPFTSKPFFNEVVFFHKPTRSLFMADVYWNYPSSQLPNHLAQLEQYKQSPSSTSNEFDLSLQADQISVPVPFGTRLWKFGMDRVYLPFYRRLMVGGGERRRRYESLVRTILDEWRPAAILPCHGDVVLGEALCRSVLTSHFQV